jgi:membrane-associated phospholipid phosphatase
VLHWVLAASLLVAPAVKAPRQIEIPANSPTTPYTLDPIPHLIATAGAILTVGLGEALVKPVLLGGFDCPTIGEGASVQCDPSRLWGFDKPVVHWQSNDWRTSSDYTATSAIVLAVLGTNLDAFLSDSATPTADAATDTLMLAESLVFATVFTHALKFAIRRPRPTMYHPGTYSVENQLSFPSGHTSATAAVATTATVTFALRHPTSPWRYAVAGGGALLTVATAVGRVGGGMHFVSDVLAGAILGSTVGFVLPWINRTPARMQVIVTPDELGGDRMQMGVEVPY